MRNKHKRQLHCTHFFIVWKRPNSHDSALKSTKSKTHISNGASWDIPSLPGQNRSLWGLAMHIWDTRRVNIWHVSGGRTQLQMLFICWMPTWVNICYQKLYNLFCRSLNCQTNKLRQHVHTFNFRTAYILPCYTTEKQKLCYRSRVSLKTPVVPRKCGRT